ncbi:MAG: iron dependent repressor, metal binding and dimerization domain protein [Bacilli bacterium]|nr:iron dependent repressor, metal binding and dimerization domain protein [Bacilli bacterium]MDD4547784.1 iron dependent repressor, metal binding and dimerization domain protein [Bacilli bacterium]
MDNEFHTVRGYELKNNAKKITPAMEDYLEMIYRTSLENNYIRTNQLSKLLNVRNSSVSKMTQKLGDLGLVNYEKYGIITLTNKGKKLGSFLLKRHLTLESFLKLLGCQQNILIQTELMEHVIDNETVEKMQTFINFFDQNKDILNDYILFSNNS